MSLDLTELHMFTGGKACLALTAGNLSKYWASSDSEANPDIRLIVNRVNACKEVI